MKTLLILGLALPVSAASVIVNGNFESGTLTAGETNNNFGAPATTTTLPGWVFGINTVVALNTGNGSNGNGNNNVQLVSPTGDNQVSFTVNPDAGVAPVPGLNVSLSQSFPTVVGTTYTVGYDYGVVFANNVSNGLALGITAAIFDGAVSGTVATQSGSLASLSSTRLGGNTNSGATTAYNTGFNARDTFNFTAISTDTTLVFTESGSSSRSANPSLDNITVEPVPEPSAFALLGLSGLGLLLRRRRA